jgi:hypothetical protein
LDGEQRMMRRDAGVSTERSFAAVIRKPSSALVGTTTG